MSDIFDEKEELKNLISFVRALHNDYKYVVGNKPDLVTAFTSDRFKNGVRTQLFREWPGNDKMVQFLQDVFEFMEKTGLSPGDFT